MVLTTVLQLHRVVFSSLCRLVRASKVRMYLTLYVGSAFVHIHVSNDDQQEWSHGLKHQRSRSNYNGIRLLRVLFNSLVSDDVIWCDGLSISQ